MSSASPQMAWVVFSNQTDLPYLRILKKGFRHCYVLMSDGEKWFSIDPLAHMTEVGFHSFDAPFNLPLWLKSQGYTVMRVAVVTPALKPAPVMLFTCVETVKRLVGLQSRLVVTPWQLYRHLLKIKNNKQKGLPYGKSYIAS